MIQKKIFYCLTIFSNIILILIAGCNYAYGQSEEIDSLRLELSQTTQDSQRISIMIDLSKKLKNVSLNQSQIYAENALELANVIDDREKQALALFNMGLLIYETPKRDSALTYFEKSEQIADELDLNKLQAKNLMSIAKWYRYNKFDSTKTVQCFIKSAEVSKAADYHYGTGRSYAKLASFYTKYKQIELSEKYLQLSAEYYMKLNYGGDEIAHYYNEVGNKIWDYNPKKSMDLYFKGVNYSDTYPNIKVNLAKAHNLIGEPKTALQYLNEAIPELHKMEYNRMLGIALAQLGEVYIQLEDYEKVIETCDQGISLLTPLGRSDQRALPDIYRLKGMVMEKTGHDSEALDLFTKSLEEAHRIGYQFGIAKSELAIGNYFITKNISKGKKYCKNVLKTTRVNSYTNLEIEACDCLYNIYKQEQIHDLALLYYEQKVMLSESVSTLKLEHLLDVNKKIVEKDKQLAEESYQKEIKEEQLNNQYSLNKVLSISSLVALLLIASLLYNIRKVRDQNDEITQKKNELKDANRRLGQSNEELERFASIASHDLKSPLKNIINFTGLLRRKLGDDISPSIKEIMNFIENSGKRMDQLVDDILQYSRISSTLTDEDKPMVNLNKLVDEISSMISVNQKSSFVNIEKNELPTISWNYSKLFLLFKNLMENGLKYNTSNEPKLKFHYSDLDGYHTVSIQDNGIGIKEEYHEKIFIMFQRLHNQNEYEGTGLGLATCKKIVDDLGGNISVHSEEGKGTMFKISFPKNLVQQSNQARQASR